MKKITLLGALSVLLYSVPGYAGSGPSSLGENAGPTAAEAELAEEEAEAELAEEEAEAELAEEEAAEEARAAGLREIKERIRKDIAEEKQQELERKQKK